ncbi:CCAAT-box DNA binding protein subunit B, partial [Reticulomyxa filosa]
MKLFSSKKKNKELRPTEALSSTSSSSLTPEQLMKYANDNSTTHTTTNAENSYRELATPNVPLDNPTPNIVNAQSSRKTSNAGTPQQTLFDTFYEASEMAYVMGKGYNHIIGFHDAKLLLSNYRNVNVEYVSAADLAIQYLQGKSVRQLKNFMENEAVFTKEIQQLFLNGNGLSRNENNANNVNNNATIITVVADDNNVDLALSNTPKIKNNASDHCNANTSVDGNSMSLSENIDALHVRHNSQSIVDRDNQRRKKSEFLSNEWDLTSLKPHLNAEISPKNPLHLQTCNVPTCNHLSCDPSPNHFLEHTSISDFQTNNEMRTSFHRSEITPSNLSKKQKCNTI